MNNVDILIKVSLLHFNELLGEPDKAIATACIASVKQTCNQQNQKKHK